MVIAVNETGKVLGQVVHVTRTPGHSIAVDAIRPAAVILTDRGYVSVPLDSVTLETLP